MPVCRISAWDVDPEKKLTIESVSSGSHPGFESQPVLHFRETDKVLGVNGLNLDRLTKLFGDGADLVDKQITLYATTCRFGESVYHVVRIR